MTQTGIKMGWTLTIRPLVALSKNVSLDVMLYLKETQLVGWLTSHLWKHTALCVCVCGVCLTGAVYPWKRSVKETWCVRGPDGALWAGKAGSFSSTPCSYWTQNQFPLSVRNSDETHNKNMVNDTSLLCCLYGGALKKRDAHIILHYRADWQQYRWVAEVKLSSWYELNQVA